MANSSAAHSSLPISSEALGYRVAEREKVRDVARRVRELARRQRAPRPVCELVALQEPYAEGALDELDEGRRHLPEEAGRHLRVEEPPRNRPAGTLENLEVLLGGVQDCQALAAEDLCERRDVDRERVHERDPALPGELEEGEVGEVGPLPVELGVEAVDLAARELVDKSVEGGRVADPAVVAHTGRAPHDGARAADGTPYPGRFERRGTRTIASLRAPEAGARGPAVPVPHFIFSVLMPYPP